MTIGLIAPPWVEVPPSLYGGTELVMDNLARGLVDAGHRVSLFTTGDSTCSVERHWIFSTARGTTGAFIDELTHVEAAYSELDGCDIIHDHTLVGPMWAILNHIPIPVVTTVHGEFTPTLTKLYEGIGAQVAVVAISHHQRRSAPSVPVACVIHHGIDVDRFPMGRGDGGYVLFLGRMNPTKGVHRAIRVAHAAGKQLRIAAKMWEPIERRYFAERIEPLLGPDVSYIGQIGGRDKLNMLAGAEALINPIRWPEPFGLVMIEALATGTPVLAFAEGAAPEIVDHGRTGFLCRDEQDMVTKLRRIGEIDRVMCRRAAEQRFSTGRMVAEHLALYQHVLESHAQVSDLRRRRSDTVDCSGWVAETG